MATINYAAREISVKIVYYGPGLSGKTTNLQIIHRKIPQKSKSDMVSLATETDRTLFFDFLPLDLGKIRGFSTKFQLYTVPGQVYYNATRKLVLRGVDGIVFIADSAADKYDENVESFNNMEENLSEYGYKRESIPTIIQYNKRDLPNALPTAELNNKFNKYNLIWNDAIASKGKGVFESLKLIGKLVIDQLNQKYSSSTKKRTTKPVQKPQPPAQPMGPRNVHQKPIKNPPQYRDQNPQGQNPQQADGKFMKFGEINIEPMAPKNFPLYPEETPAGTINMNLQENNKNKQYYDPQQNQQPPHPQRNNAPQNNPMSYEEPVFDPQGQQNYQGNNNPDMNYNNAPGSNFEPQQPYSNQPPMNSDYGARDMAQNPQNTQFSDDPNDHDNGNKPMFFTSINKEKQRKKGKKPINPKHRAKQSFFSKLFKRDN